MPSPFPGMDPYLEHPAIWPNLHHQLISVIEAELNHQLRPKYFANVENRVYLSDENDPGHDIVVPDVHLLSRGSAASPGRIRSAGGVATIEPIEETTVEDEVHDARIEIVDRLSRAVVTVIEILSPTNKLNGSYGRESYQGKRREILSSATHLMEIDLLRGGVRMNIPERTPPLDYLIHVSRAEGKMRRRAQFWPIPLRSPLPIIPVPLAGEDPDAHLDLQQLFQIAYDRGAFDMKVDYASEPVPPLNPDQMKWAGEVTGRS